MGEDGFEPSKRNATDLQSAPFGHSGTLPGAGDGTRTRDLLITNQLLYQLSYTSICFIVSFPEHYYGLSKCAFIYFHFVKNKSGGSYRARTCDILLVRQTLSQLS